VAARLTLAAGGSSLFLGAPKGAPFLSRKVGPTSKQLKTLSLVFVSRASVHKPAHYLGMLERVWGLLLRAQRAIHPGNAHRSEAAVAAVAVGFGYLTALVAGHEVRVADC
jgi:hypothetical protein